MSAQTPRDLRAHSSGSSDQIDDPFAQTAPADPALAPSVDGSGPAPAENGGHTVATSSANFAAEVAKEVHRRRVRQAADAQIRAEATTAAPMP